MDTLLDLAAYGLVEATVTDGPIDMANAFGVAKDVHLFQIMDLFGGYARVALHSHLNPTVRTIHDLEFVDPNILLEAAQAIMSACSNWRSQLPDRTLGTLLTSAMPAQVDHAKLSVAYLMAESANRGGAGAALLRRAVRIITKFPQWPSTPWWPAIIAECRNTVRQYGALDEARLLDELADALIEAPAMVPFNELDWFIHRGWYMKAVATVVSTQVMKPKVG